MATTMIATVVPTGNDAEVDAEFGGGNGDGWAGGDGGGRGGGGGASTTARLTLETNWKSESAVGLGVCVMHME